MNQLIDQPLELQMIVTEKLYLKQVQSTIAFWVKVKGEYPDIATESLKALLPFPTLYLY